MTRLPLLVVGPVLVAGMTLSAVAAASIGSDRLRCEVLMEDTVWNGVTMVRITPVAYGPVHDRGQYVMYVAKRDSAGKSISQQKGMFLIDENGRYVYAVSLFSVAPGGSIEVDLSLQSAEREVKCESRVQATR